MTKIDLEDLQLLKWRNIFSPHYSIETILLRNVNELMLEFKCSANDVGVIKQVLSKQYLMKTNNSISSWKDMPNVTLVSSLSAPKFCSGFKSLDSLLQERLTPGAIIELLSMDSYCDPSSLCLHILSASSISNYLYNQSIATCEVNQNPTIPKKKSLKVLYIDTCNRVNSSQSVYKILNTSLSNSGTQVVDQGLLTGCLGIIHIMRCFDITDLVQLLQSIYENISKEDWFYNVIIIDNIYPLLSCYTSLNQANTTSNSSNTSNPNTNTNNNNVTAKDKLNQVMYQLAAVLRQLAAPMSGYGCTLIINNATSHSRHAVAMYKAESIGILPSESDSQHIQTTQGNFPPVPGMVKRAVVDQVYSYYANLPPHTATPHNTSPFLLSSHGFQEAGLLTLLYDEKGLDISAIPNKRIARIYVTNSHVHNRHTVNTSNISCEIML